MSKSIRDILEETYLRKSENILNILSRWSLSCWPLVKASSTRHSLDDAAIRFLTLDVLSETLNASGIDPDRPFVSRKDLTEAFDLEKSILISENTSLRIQVEEYERSYSLPSSLDLAEDITYILDSYGPSYGVNPMIQRAASSFGVCLIHQQLLLDIQECLKGRS